MLKGIYDSFFLLRSTLWYPRTLPRAMIIVIAFLHAEFILDLSDVKGWNGVSVLIFDIVLNLDISGSTTRTFKLIRIKIYTDISIDLFVMQNNYRLKST